MDGFASGLFFGGTEQIEPSGRDELILNGGIGQPYAADDSDPDDRIPLDNPHTGDKRDHSPTINNERASKKQCHPGGRPAVNKRVVADYDSDDGRIISLKQQGYSDDYVAQKMIQEGRMRYVPKTVGSRWLRLRNALEKAENDKLDDELSDWHVGEDNLLKTSVDVIETKFEQDMQKLIDRKWKEISANLADRLGRKKYTAKACHDRYEGVQQGTALLPIEIDPDKEGRKTLREERIAAAKHLRAEQAAEAQRVEEERKRRLAEKKAEADEKERERIFKVHERKEIKAEEERTKKEKLVDKVKKKAAKEAALAQARAEAEWEKTKRSADAALLAQLTGKRVRGARTRRTTRRATGTNRRAGRRSRNDYMSDEDDEEDAIELSDEDEAEMSDDEREESDVDDSNFLDGDGSSSLMKGGPSKKGIPIRVKPAMTTKPKVTKETLLNPRSIMTDAELSLALHVRHLAPPGRRETHPQVVARFHAADQELTTLELSDLLRPFFDKGKGSKVVKIQRLQEHEAAQSAAGDKGVKSTDLAFKKGYEGYKGAYSSMIEDEDEAMAE